MQKIIMSEPLRGARNFDFIFEFSLSYWLKLAFGLTFLLIAACSTQIKDGPPAYNIDVSKISNPVPRAEPRSRFGNPRCYSVYGHRYYVLKTSKNYVQRGYASWYGTKFHAHRTSSGEPYNMFSMTGASKTLPLPTYVQVTNLENGRNVIVKVNDRGPFKRDRVMDLSYVAAKKLGMLPKGTAYVEVRSIDPNTWNTRRGIPYQDNPPAYASSDPSKNELFLQVAALRNKESAERLRAYVAEITQTPARIQTIAGLSPTYRVQIGPLASDYKRDTVTQRLIQKGFNTPIRVTN